MAAEIQYQLAMVGAEKPAFETIVASGCRTAMPHARPTGSQIRRNAILLIDMGAQADGYTSDMTRMLVPGRATKRMERLYGYVLDAQLAAVEAVRPGATISGVDKAARNALKSQNLDRYFVHSTGHGLGLEIHETPSVSSAATGVLEEGMVITIEPGVYLEGVGGIRIEDTVVVTRTGHEILTPTPKELLVV
jgi:Xaa-Pro aminopeptidase